MVPLQHFFTVPFPCDVAALLHSPQLQRDFGWDYQHWRQVQSELCRVCMHLFA